MEGSTWLCMHLITNRIDVEPSSKFTFACFDVNWTKVCACVRVCVGGAPFYCFVGEMQVFIQLMLCFAMLFNATYSQLFVQLILCLALLFILTTATVA
jgi:hypothetical protein